MKTPATTAGMDAAMAAETRAAPVSASAATVGLVGLGLLGSAVAERLVRAGYRVVGYDLKPERVAALASLGGHGATSLAAVAAACRIVITALPTLDAVEQAICGSGGILDDAQRHSVIVQMSTVSPRFVQRLEETARMRGVGLLDAPISGTSTMVARGEGLIVVGGDRGAFDRCRPVLEAVARRVYHVGHCGRASQIKLVTNLVMGLNTVALAEGLMLARRSGLDPAETLEILAESAASSRMLEVRGPLMVAGRFDPMVTTEVFLKDLALILEEAAALGAPVPLGALMRQLLEAAAAYGWAGQDLAVVAAVYDRLAALK